MNNNMFSITVFFILLYECADDCGCLDRVARNRIDMSTLLVPL